MRELDKDLEPEKIKIEESINFYKKLAWVVIGSAFISIIFLFVVNFSLAPEYLTLEETGTYFGGVAGALFGLAGVFLVYIAFLGQRLQMLYQQQELRDNRNELELNRVELRGQKEEMAKLNHLNNETLNNQYFFKLLEIFRFSVEEFILLTQRDEIPSDYSGFQKIHEFLKSSVMPEGFKSREGEFSIQSPKVEDIERHFIIFRSTFRGLEKFNQLLKVILEFLEKNHLDGYHIILEASMGFHEKSISFLFLVFDKGYNLDYLSKNGFLKSVNKESLLNSDIYTIIYPIEE